jgi:hypothetical protein
MKQNIWLHSTYCIKRIQGSHVGMATREIAILSTSHGIHVKSDRENEGSRSGHAVFNHDEPRIDIRPSLGSHAS